jgi:hypothetical protein
MFAAVREMLPRGFHSRFVSTKSSMSPTQTFRTGTKKAALGLAIILIALSGAVLFHSSGTPKHHKVTLRWHRPQPARGIRVLSYNVYRSTISGGPYTKVATRVHDEIYVDNHVNSKTIYFYVVTAVSDSGKESGYSNEVTAKIP